MQRTIATMLLALLATLGVASCGSSGPEQLKAAAFRARAEDICRTLQSNVETAEKAARNSAVVDRLVVSVDDALSAFAKIAPPATQQAAYARLKDGYTAQRRALEHLRAPHPRLTSADRRALSGQDHRTTIAARTLRLKACA